MLDAIAIVLSALLLVLGVPSQMVASIEMGDTGGGCNQLHACDDSGPPLMLAQDTSTQSPQMGDTLDPGQARPPLSKDYNYKNELIAATKTFIDDTDRTDGLSGQYFKIADPQVIIPKVQAWVTTVHVDPVYCEKAGNTGVTDPNFCATAIFRGFKNGGEITLKVDPSADPNSAFHECIHAADFSTGGDGINDNNCFAPHYFDNEIPGLLKRLHNDIDPMIMRVVSAIKSKSPQAGQQRTDLMNRISTVERQLTRLEQDPGWQKAMAATGAQFDIAGYRRAVQKLLDDASTEDSAETPDQSRTAAVNLNGDWLCTSTTQGGTATTQSGTIKLPSGFSMSAPMKIVQKGTELTVEFGGRTFSGGMNGNVWIVQYNNPSGSSSKITLFYNRDTNSFEGQSEERQSVPGCTSVTLASLKLQRQP